MKEKVRNILVLTNWNYSDALIQSHTLPYLKIIHDLTPSAGILLVTQEKDKSYIKGSERAKIDQALTNYGIQFKPQRYYRFGFLKLINSLFQFFQLWWLIVSKKITHIHCFCTPAGGFGYFLSILSGKSLILDSYEPHAEAMVENGTWSKQSLAFKILWWLERKQSLRANYRIGIATGMLDYARNKWGVAIQQVGLKPCCVDLNKFQFDEDFHGTFRKKQSWSNSIVCVYAGKFGGIYLEQEVFDLFSTAYRFWGGRFRVLLLTGLARTDVESYCKRSNVPIEIFYVTRVPFEEMSKYLSVADFGITPVKPVPSKRYCSPIKDGEYWALGLPVVITDNISDDSRIIRQHNAGAVIEKLENDSYLDVITKIDSLLAEPKDHLRKRIRRLAEQYRNYNIAVREYTNIYGSGENL
jgi:glycosyltransferase involved in cell wall biosynthesis